MATTNYIFTQINPEFITQGNTFTTLDSNLVEEFSINSTFNPASNYSELHYYSLDGTLLQSNSRLSSFTTAQDSIRTEDSNFSSINLRLEQDLLAQGYEFGDVYLYYNFLNDLFTTNNASHNFYIEEISPDRLELRLISLTLTGSEVEVFVNEVKNRFTRSDFNEFKLNLGENNLPIGVNIDTLDYKDTKSVVVRLYQPLSQDITTKQTLNIVETVSDSLAFIAQSETILDEEAPLFIKGPNFSLNSTEESNFPTEFFNTNQLYSYPVTSSFFEAKSLFEENSAELSIDYSSYENFIHFSSAQERLLNFKYKVDQLNTYQSESLRRELSSNNQAGITGSKAYYDSLINNILSNFDHYDRFLYYESSSFSWPKSGDFKPYNILVGDSTGSWFNQALTSASLYDSNNPHLLLHTIPEFLREDPNNIKLGTFVHMIAHHFDNLWIYSKGVSEKFNTDNRINFGISRDLLEDALKNFGVKLYNSSKSTEELFKIFTGEAYELTETEFGTRLSSAELISGSSDIISSDTYRKQIYKRLYHNLPQLLKSKGTEKSLRTLFSSFGVPSLYSSGSHNGLTVNQIGGTVSGSFNLGTDQFVTSSLGRIRIDNTGSLVSGNTLSTDISIIKRDSKYSKDSNLLEVGFSPSNFLNTLIIASSSLDNFDIDSILGDPRLNFSSSYDTLLAKSEQYLSQYSNSRYDLKDFIRVLKFYDNVLFKTVKDFVPGRTNLSSGVIIKPHLLERSKAKQTLLSSKEYTHLPGTYRLSDTGSLSKVKRQFTGDITLTGSIEVGTYSGSSGGSFGGNNQYTASYSSFKKTADGLALYNYHSHDEAKYDGEFSGSNLLISDGELNRDNTFKYFTGTTLRFSYDFIDGDTDCEIIWGEYVPSTPAPSTVSPTVEPTPNPTPEPTTGTPEPTVEPTPNPTPEPTTGTPEPTVEPTPDPTPEPVFVQQWADFYIDPTGYASEQTACSSTSLGTHVFYTASIGNFSSLVSTVQGGTPVRIYTVSSLTPGNEFTSTGLFHGADSTGPNASYAFYVNSSGDVGVAYDCNSTPEPVATPTYSTLILYAAQADGTGWDTSTEACSNSGTVFQPLYYAYGDSITNTTLYTDTNLTSAFNGNLKWYSDSSSTYAIKIAANGTTSSDPNWYVPDCSATPSPTPEPTPAPISYYAFTVRYDANSDLTACSSTDPTTTIYSHCSTITTVTCKLFTDPNNPTTSYVDGGYYADTTNGSYYYVEGNGNGIVQEVGSCATPAPTPVPTAPICNSTAGVIRSLVSAEDTCSGTTSTVYHNGSTGLSDATIIYTTSGCSTVQSNTVWFNDQGTYYQWNGSTLTQIATPNCP